MPLPIHETSGNNGKGSFVFLGVIIFMSINVLLDLTLMLFKWPYIQTSHSCESMYCVEFTKKK